MSQLQKEFEFGFVRLMDYWIDLDSSDYGIIGFEKLLLADVLRSLKLQDQDQDH